MVSVTRANRLFIIAVFCVSLSMAVVYYNTLSDIQPNTTRFLKRVNYNTTAGTYYTVTYDNRSTGVPTFSHAAGPNASFSVDADARSHRGNVGTANVGTSANGTYVGTITKTRTQTGSQTHSRKTSHRHQCPARANLEKKSLKYTPSQIPKDLYKLAPKVFKESPTSFLHGYSNPCWKNGNQQIVCLPKFFLAGVAKCGTTDLWMKITSHPHIIKASEKEPSWWARKRLGKRVPLQSFTGYLQQFSNLATRIQRNAPGARKLITGDGSPSTFWDNMNWREYVPSTCKSGPTYVIADVIHAVLPGSKIIVIFRNPTDRFYSDYIFTGGNTRSPQTFHKYVVESTSLFQSCLKTKGRNLRSCVYRFCNADHYGKDQMIMLIKGLYSVFARDWLNAFPRDQLMFIRFEDWYTKCRGILPVIYRFLELGSLHSHQIIEICSKKNPTKKKNTKGPMLEKTRILLDKFYRASREDLAYILGDNRWRDWT